MVSCAALVSNIRYTKYNCCHYPCVARSPQAHTAHTCRLPPSHKISVSSTYPFLCVPDLVHCVLHLPPIVSYHFLSSLPVLSSCSSPHPLSFRVTWLLALANLVQMSTTPWCCTTTTAPAGRSRSSCPSRLTCFGGRMSALSSATAPVRRNGVVHELILSEKYHFPQTFSDCFIALRCCSLGWFNIQENRRLKKTKQKNPTAMVWEEKS